MYNLSDENRDQGFILTWHVLNRLELLSAPEAPFRLVKVEFTDKGVVVGADVFMLVFVLVMVLLFEDETGVIAFCFRCVFKALSKRMRFCWLAGRS